MTGYVLMDEVKKQENDDKDSLDLDDNKKFIEEHQGNPNAKMENSDEEHSDGMYEQQSTQTNRDYNTMEYPNLSQTSNDNVDGNQKDDIHGNVIVTRNHEQNKTVYM